MKIGLAPISIAFVFASVALACANAANSNPGGVVPGTDGGADAKPASTTESEDDPPHALGIIQLSTTHAAGATSSTPFVSAGFIPDSTKAPDNKCGKEVDGCTILAKPDCGGVDGGYNPSGCETDEVCVLDENCDSVCEKVPSCTTTCTEDQVCTLVGTKSKCVDKVDFNAGTITLSGDGMSKTTILRPPYTSKPSTGDDSPFVPGESIKIVASGAAEVGIEKFEDTFTATTFIEPKPALNKQLEQELVFESTSPIPITWKGGEDQVQIMLSGNKGTAVCKADDASGEFEVSRKVLKAVFVDDGTSYSTPSVSVTLSRTRTELRKDKKTVGELPTGELPPVAFVRLTTTSTETYTAQGCPSGQKMCTPAGGGTGVCTSVLTDRYNCGDCNVVCASSPTYKYCYSGVCQ